MRWRTLGPVLLAAVMVASCGTSESDTSDEPAATTTTAVVAEEVQETTSTTTAATSTTAALQSDLEILVEKDVEYLADSEGSWTMDVFYPSEPGDWPLVVVYHGMSTSRAVSAARRIAATGAVAIAPQWLKTTAPSLAAEDYIDGQLFDRAACATSAAQRVGSEFGADPTNTTIVGFSAGVHPAGWVGLGVVRTDVCDRPIAYQPTGLVLGDSQLIFHEAGWDESFADPESNAGDTTDRFVNPERWNMPDDAAVYLWSSDFVYGRTITNPPEDDSWIWVRDTTGTLVEDLESLGAIESEFIGFPENGQLLELRMNEAGVDVTHEAIGGGHYYSEPVYEAIDALIHRELETGVNASDASSGATAGNGFVWPSTNLLEDAASLVCGDWNAIDLALVDQVNLVDVGETSWDTDIDVIVRGRADVLAALSAKDIESLECGDGVVTQGDYIAIPVSTTNGDGTGSEGIWVLKVAATGGITWINMFSIELPEAAPPSGTDQALIAEARAFCGTIEGKYYRRDADEFLAFMTADPTAQAIPNVYHMAGEEAIRSMIALYLPGDVITCEDGGISNGVWSATGTTLTHPQYTIYLEGITVHLHTPDGIKDLYYLWTDAGMQPGWGVGTWGMPPNP